MPTRSTAGCRLCTRPSIVVVALERIEYSDAPWMRKRRRLGEFLREAAGVDLVEARHGEILGADALDLRTQFGEAHALRGRPRLEEQPSDRVARPGGEEESDEVVALRFREPAHQPEIEHAERPGVVPEDVSPVRVAVEEAVEEGLFAGGVDDLLDSVPGGRHAQLELAQRLALEEL